MDIADMPDDIRDRILAVQEKSGFVPNVFLTLAHRPDEFRAFFAYHDALMDKPGNLSKAECEMIVVATSNLNQCQYCVVAHGAILRIRAKNPLIADQVAVNYRKADITARQNPNETTLQHLDPAPGETAGGFAETAENIALAGAPLVDRIVADWQAWKDGVPPLPAD
ncbi:peroxidase-related enzyme [Paracoccus sp. SSJ]|uniref:peroxidase-related enzyme n=1 Tax=Paracoccus sp. SSJ TaxID=3050636 RepID=UPI0025506CF9|nr:peroxidase-related enzyme [Paracoccus sp. SSJ]MDK8874247.1 peroxidase-related enzyme [Paracoccus sp. SSJ]